MCVGKNTHCTPAIIGAAGEQLQVLEVGERRQKYAALLLDDDHDDLHAVERRALDQVAIDSQAGDTRLDRIGDGLLLAAQDVAAAQFNDQEA